MRFTFKNNIAEPDAKLELANWAFSDDLRNVFDMLHSNHDIGELFRKRGVIAFDDELDCESSCTWVYFQTEKAARAFITRLNSQPEVKAYKKPKKEVCLLFTRRDQDKLSDFLTKTLTPDQFKQLKALNIKVIDVQEHWVAAK